MASWRTVTPIDAFMRQWREFVFFPGHGKELVARGYEIESCAGGQHWSLPTLSIFAQASALITQDCLRRRKPVQPCGIVMHDLARFAFRNGGEVVSDLLPRERPYTFGVRVV